MAKKMSFRVADSKILDRDQVGVISQAAKSDGKTVVFTNGCFDILHIGHVRYLQDARALGDVLVVGLNSDESVKRLKGPERPVVSELDRAEILAALECVDYLCIFPEDTPIELLEVVRPSIHVKGGDYRVEDLAEGPVVLKHGGRVEIVSFTSTATEGRSTSNIIGRIVEKHR